jgi:N-acetylglucosaminyldiphosphoundecaprenol N-acetyl-beta-D-mannosaminyltransferase
MMTQEPHAVVKVGPFTVAACSQAELVSRIVEWPLTAGPAVMCHLHVGALNNRHDAEFVAAMDDAEMVYADGMATVLVGRAGGASELERAGLTDIGHLVIEQLSEALGRTVRLAVLGGPEGLARAAGETLSRMHNCEMVQESHGYRDDAEWSTVLTETRAAAPDIVFVGLGMPQEALWAQQFRAELPAALILPAGGFFGHVVGDEKRAPDWAQKIGMEWMWRVGQAPKRLAARYAKGLATTAVLSVQAFRARR